MSHTKSDHLILEEIKRARENITDYIKNKEEEHYWDAYRKLKTPINTVVGKKLFDNSFSGNSKQFWKYISAK